MTKTNTSTFRKGDVVYHAIGTSGRGVLHWTKVLVTATPADTDDRVATHPCSWETEEPLDFLRSGSPRFRERLWAKDVERPSHFVNGAYEWRRPVT